MKIECDGVKACWVTVYKKTGNFKVVFEEYAQGLILNGRFIEFTFGIDRRGFYCAHVFMPGVSLNQDEVVDALSGGFHYDRFPDPNYYLDKAVDVLNRFVSDFPRAAPHFKRFGEDQEEVLLRLNPV